MPRVADWSAYIIICIYKDTLEELLTVWVFLLKYVGHRSIHLLYYYVNVSLRYSTVACM